MVWQQGRRAFGIFVTTLSTFALIANTAAGDDDSGPGQATEAEIIYPTEQISEAKQPEPASCPATLERGGRQSQNVDQLADAVMDALIEGGTGVAQIHTQLRDDIRAVTLSSLDAPIPDMLNAPMNVLSTGSVDGQKLVTYMRNLLGKLDELAPDTKKEPAKKWYQQNWRDHMPWLSKSKEIAVASEVEVDPGAKYENVKEAIEGILKSLRESGKGIENDLAHLRPELARFKDLVDAYNAEIRVIEENIAILRQKAVAKKLDGVHLQALEADILLPLTQALLDRQQMRDICLHGVHALSQNIRMGEENIRTLERVTGVTYPAAIVNLMGAVASAGQERGHKVAAEVTRFTSQLIGHSNTMLEAQGDREQQYAANGVLNVGMLQDTIKESLELADKLDLQRRDRLQLVEGLVEQGKGFGEIRQKLLERSRGAHDETLRQLGGGTRSSIGGQRRLPGSRP